MRLGSIRSNLKEVHLSLRNCLVLIIYGFDSFYPDLIPARILIQAPVPAASSRTSNTALELLIGVNSGDCEFMYNKMCLFDNHVSGSKLVALTVSDGGRRDS